MNLLSITWMRRRRRALACVATAFVSAAALAAENPEINVWVSRDVAPGPHIRVNINTRDLPVVHAALYPIDGVKWLKLFSEDRETRPKPIGEAAKQWNITVAQKGQVPRPGVENAYYSRQVNLPVMKPGVYMLSITGGGLEKWKVVNVTNLAVVVKRSPYHMLTWVTDAITGKVVPGAKVWLFDRGGDKVVQGETGTDGTFMVPVKPGREAVVVNRGADYAGFDCTGMNLDGRLTAHFQTDRPVYRPGQTVSFKVILRRTLGQGYVPVGNDDFTMNLVDPKGNTIDKAKLHANANGAVAGSFEIPEEGALGDYSLIGYLGFDNVYGRFAVQEYRKPEYQVAVKAGAKRYLAGDEAEFDVDAQLYFGAPVPQAQVSYTITRSPNLFYGDYYDNDYNDGNLYARDTYRSTQPVAADNVYTDKDGKVRIKFKTDPNAPDCNYSISLTVQDASRRQVTAGAYVPVYAASIRLGMSTDVVLAPAGSLVPIELHVQDLDGRPCAAKVELKMYKFMWVEKEGKYKQVEILSDRVSVPPTGKTVIKLPAKAEGQVLIEAVAADPTKRKTKASMMLYVAGPFEKMEREVEQPQVDVRVDRRTYEPGQSVNAFVTTNRPNRPILIVLEGRDIWQYLVVPPGKRSKLWTAKASALLSPNAYISVEQWVDGERLSGNALVPIPDKTRRIGVKLSSDKSEYQPGDKARYSLTTVDSQGRPTSAEVALSVVDEAIYAIRADSTADLYQTYWGLRQNAVTTTASAPEELSGGAYQKTAAHKADTELPGARKAIAPRTRFEDTAYWNAFVETGPDGKADISFEVPGNLTAWRAVARGLTKATSVGVDSNTVRANRPVMLRLATPRQMVVGDTITLIGTVDNRTPDRHEFEVTLAAKDMALSGAATQKITLDGKSQGKVEWVLKADSLPTGGAAQLQGQIVALDVPVAQSEEYSDALRVQLRIVPKGVEERLVTSGVVGESVWATCIVPQDRIEGVGKAVVTVWTGFQSAMDEAATRVLQSYRYGSVGAASHLAVAATLGLASDDKEVRESMALLSRDQQSGGWGWWSLAPVDPVVTARVMSAVGYARMAGIEVYDNMLRSGKADLVDLFKRTNLWEHKALLAAASTFAGDDGAPALIDEVVTRGELMSPYARLRLAEALCLLGKNDGAKAMLEDVLKDASEGPASTYLPCGDGIGWSATDVETTAQALATMVRLGVNPEMQSRLARWLVLPGENRWQCEDENAAVVRALRMYLNVHPEAKGLGSVEVEVGGHKVAATPSKIGSGATAVIPMDWLKIGPNPVTIRRSEGGEAFYTIEERVYKPGLYETMKGIRVLRRFEVRNPAGIWVELRRKVKPSEPVRCTVVVWGDDIEDALKVVEPIPSGFEYIESDRYEWGREEVRDGAVVHYLLNGGTPQTFRYYIRAESEGRLVALPATGEYLRRPANRGQSGSEPIEVAK